MEQARTPLAAARQPSEATTATGEHQPSLRWLRRAPVTDPGGGSSALLDLPPGATLQLPEPPSEALLLAGTARLGTDDLVAGEYVWWPAGGGSSGVEAGADGARLLLVLGGLSLPAGSDVPSHRWGGLLDGDVGYADSGEQVYRLPLRRERTRGELTWLLRWPAGFRGVPTRASGVGLEGWLLAGDLRVSGTVYGPDAYLWFESGAIPDEWQTVDGCRVLLRTVAREGADG